MWIIGYGDEADVHETDRYAPGGVFTGLKILNKFSYLENEAAE
jgi:hypothetical protein